MITITVSLFCFLSFNSCSSDKNSDNLATLPTITCLVQCQVLFEFTNPITKKRSFIDANGDISTNAQSCAPFQSQGTGVILGNNNFIGTVKHLYLLNYENTYRSNEIFKKNLDESLRKIGLIYGSSDGVEPTIVTAWFALPNTPKIPIAESLKNDPFKIPDGCYGLDLCGRGRGDVDLAIFKISAKSSLPSTYEGFSLEDIADEPTIEKIKVGDEIETSGYPNGTIINANDFIVPQPAEAKVTAVPSASVALLQTNLQSNFGGSGSFVLSKETGKIVGVLKGQDTQNQSNIVCVPANFLRSLLKEQLDNPNLKKNKKPD